MTKINFIFKNNQYFNGVGGKLPSNEDPTIDVHIKSQKGYYYLAETEDINFWKLSKWDPMPVNDQVARGFPLINITQLPKYPNDPDNDEMRNLTTEEQEDKHTAEKALKKMETRSQIHGQIGDIYDLVADLSKRVGMMERIVARTIHFLYNSSSLSSEIPQEFKDNYGTFLDQYIYDVDNSNYMDRIDIENIDSIYSELKTRYNIITDLVNNYLNY